MVQLKTAALTSAAAAIGARIGSEDRQLVELFARYGEELGIAYQIADDILGIWGEPSVTGKPVGADILAKKKSLPILAGLRSDESGELARLLGGEIVSADDVPYIIMLLDRTGARQAAEDLAESYLRRALAALDRTRLDNPAMRCLRALARSAAQREK